MDVGRILPLPGRSIWKCKDKAGCGLRVRRIQSTPGLCLVIVKAKAAGIRSRTDRGKERKVWAEGEDASKCTGGQEERVAERCERFTAGWRTQGRGGPRKRKKPRQSIMVKRRLLVRDIRQRDRYI
ncbi:hypothetical protein K438DRAFT_1780745 [Mycena galopus ATCC 62051]|nr:hypothetical protein K438DRAFT_1780745 [Mycena galopus ATCC 62051]